MLILRQYLLNQLAKEFVLALTVLSLVLVGVDQAIFLAQSFHFPYQFLLDLMIMNLPIKLSFVIPLAFFFSLIRTTYHLLQSREWLIITCWASSRVVLLSTLYRYSIAVFVLSALLSCLFIPKLIDHSQTVMDSWRNQTDLVEVLVKNSIAQFSRQQEEWFLKGDAAKKKKKLNNFLSLKLDEFTFDVVHADTLSQDSHSHRLLLENGQRTWGELNRNEVNYAYFKAIDIHKNLLTTNSQIGQMVKESPMSTWQLYQKASSNHIDPVLAKVLFLRLSQPFLTLFFAIFFVLSVHNFRFDQSKFFIKKSFVLFLVGLITTLITRNCIGKVLISINQVLVIYPLFMLSLILLSQMIKSKGENR